MYYHWELSINTGSSYFISSRDLDVAQIFMWYQQDVDSICHYTDDVQGLVASVVHTQIHKVAKSSDGRSDSIFIYSNGFLAVLLTR